MSDPMDGNTPAGQNPPPDTGLAERLYARRTHSLGLIDVRGAEAHYARIMDWLAARTPLLEQLRSRYGLTEDEKARGLSLAFAETPAQAESSGASTAAGAFVAPESSSNAPRPEGPAITYVAHVPEEPAPAAAEARRIGRRGMPTFTHAGSVPRPGTEPHTAERVSDEPTSVRGNKSPTPDGSERLQGGSGGEQVERRSEQPSANSTPATVKESPAPPELHTAQMPLTQTQAPPPLPTPSTAPSETAPAKANTSAGEVMTPESPGDAETLKRVSEIVPATGGPITQLSTVKSGARGSANPNPSSTNRNPAYQNHVSPSEIAAQAAPPSVASPGLSVHTQGGTSRSETGREVVNREVTTGAAGVGLFNLRLERAAQDLKAPLLPLARAPEIPPRAHPGSGATTQAQSTLPLAASRAADAGAHETQETPQPHRRETGHAMAGNAQQTATHTEFKTTDSSRAGARAPELNVEKLTEQVSRHLARRLLIERERRGLVKR